MITDIPTPAFQQGQQKFDKIKAITSVIMIASWECHITANPTCTYMKIYS